MKPSSLPALLLVTALVCAAPAAAKELTKVTLCGQNDKCAAITDADKLRQVPRGGATSIPAPPPQPFYTLTLSIDHGDESGPLLIYYLPRYDLLAANGEEAGEMVWLPIADPQGKEILRQATKDLDPFPAPTPGRRSSSLITASFPTTRHPGPSCRRARRPRPDSRRPRSSSRTKAPPPSGSMVSLLSA